MVTMTRKCNGGELCVMNDQLCLFQRLSARAPYGNCWSRWSLNLIIVNKHHITRSTPQSKLFLLKLRNSLKSSYLHTPSSSETNFRFFPSHPNHINTISHREKNLFFFLPCHQMADYDVPKKTVQSGPFPHETYIQPFWRSELHPLDDHRSTKDLPTECDILIVGAGYAGVTTAYHLIKDRPDPPSIVLLEARQACSGATARNGRYKTGALKAKMGSHH